MAQKTNVMRVLEQKKISYRSYDYSSTGETNGVEVARILGEDVRQVFKTLVTVGASKRNYVFVIPVARELDLKKAASAAGEKNIAMVKSKELLPLTGYVHGGCSPIGMKKAFPTFLDRTAGELDTILFSGGKVGFQVEVAVADLGKVISCQLADLVKD